VHIRGVKNPTGILSKHWAYANVKHVMRPLLFWYGDTAEIACDINIPKSGDIDSMEIEGSDTVQVPRISHLQVNQTKRKSAD
jgi:hypothetical protein